MEASAQHLDLQAAGRFRCRAAAIWRAVPCRAEPSHNPAKDIALIRSCEREGSSDRSTTGEVVLAILAQPISSVVASRGALVLSDDRCRRRLFEQFADRKDDTRPATGIATPVVVFDNL